MANEMGIGYSPLTDRVWMGKQNKSKGIFVGDKKDITSEFIAVSMGFFEPMVIREVSAGKEKNLFLNIPNNAASIEKVIKNLTKRLDKLKK